MTITGANLGSLGTATVNFGGTAGTIVSDTGTQITATSPAESAGTVNVTVVTAGETSMTSSADQFTYTTTMTVNAADWTSPRLTLTLGSDGNLHVYVTGTTTDVVAPYAPASATNIAITSPGTSGYNLTIDSTNGNPIPAGGLTYSGAGGLIMTASGTVALSSTNTYTGGTTVSAGTLLVISAMLCRTAASLAVGAGGEHLRYVDRYVRYIFQRYELDNCRAEYHKPGFIELGLVGADSGRRLGFRQCGGGRCDIRFRLRFAGSIFPNHGSIAGCHVTAGFGLWSTSQPEQARPGQFRHTFRGPGRVVVDRQGRCRGPALAGAGCKQRG